MVIYTFLCKSVSVPSLLLRSMRLYDVCIFANCFVVFRTRGDHHVVWKDEHEQTEIVTAISVFGCPKNNNLFIKTEKRNRNRGFGMKKTENRTNFKFSNRCITSNFIRKSMLLFISY